MTICIAANFKDGVVVAADRMISAPNLTLEFDHPNTKIRCISSSCVVLSAGNALVIDDLLMKGTGLAGQMQNPMVRSFAEHLRSRYVQIRQQLASRSILEPRGFSFESFYREGGISRMPQELAATLDSYIQQSQLGISLIVAGIDSSGPHIFGIDDPGQCVCFDPLGYHSIGSGHRHAFSRLVGLNQYQGISMDEALANIYMAKRAAEAAPGVGTATDICVITQVKDAIRIIPADTIMPQLKNWYNTHATQQHSIPSFNLISEEEHVPPSLSTADSASAEAN